MRHDATTIAICDQLIFIHREQEALLQHDPDAPEVWSPNHPRHEALAGEYAELAKALTKAAPPKTLKGIWVLAELAMTLVERSWDEKLSAPGDFADWVTLLVLMTAAGKPEAIPLPEQLPVYWPERNLH